MAKTTVEVEILAVLKQATKDIKGFAKDTQSQLDGINFKTAVSAINDGFTLIERTAGKAFGVVKGFISDAIGEASEGEEALTRVANSMRLVGDFTEAAVDDFKAYADAMQESTVNSDDAVLSALALAKNFGLTNKQAKAATSAAIDFAAATGKDLDSAVQSVSRTFTGFVDKDLAKYAPALKAASKEQLVLGEGARVIGERFRGFADALGETFQGSLAKTKNSFSNLLETIGDLIIKNPVLIDSIKIVGDVFKGLTGEVDKNKASISGFISEAVKGIAGLAPVTIQAVKGIDFLLTSISNLFQATGKLAAGFFAAIDAERQGNSMGARDAAQQSLKEVEKLYRDSQERQTGFYDPLIKSAQDAANKIQQIGLGDVKKGKIVLTVPKSEAKIMADLLENAMKQGGEDAAKTIEEAFNKQKSNVESLSKNPFSGAFPALKPGQSSPLSADQQNAAAQGAGGLSAILKGAAGATELTKGLASAVAESMVPGLGAVAGEIVGVLAQGPEKVKEMISEFTKSLPTIIENIITAIPVLIVELQKAVPLVIRALSDRAPEIAQALAKSMPEVATSFALQMPRVAIAMIQGLVKNLPDVVESFAQEFLKIPQKFLDELLGGLGDGVGAISGSGSGGVFEGIPVLGGIGDLFGFADGGRVPDVAKFNNDGLLARLSSNEQVLNGDLTDRLEGYLDEQSGEKNLVVNIVMSDQVLASQILRLNRGGFRLA